MAPLPQAPLLLAAAAILVMLGLSHCTLIQTPLQRVSLPTSTVRGYHPLSGELRRDGGPHWRAHTLRLDGRFRSKYTPKITLVNKTPPSPISSNYGPKVFQGSLSEVYGSPSTDSRPMRPSKTRLLQLLEAGRRPGPEDRQRLRSNLMDTLHKYRQLRRDSDYSFLEEVNPKERVSVYSQDNDKSLYGSFMENVMSKILSDEFNYLLEEASLKESNSLRGTPVQISKQLDLIYPELHESLASRGAFKNKLPDSLSVKLLDNIYSKLTEIKNFISSREVENSNVAPFPSSGDNFEERVQHGHDLTIFSEQDKINSVFDGDNPVELDSIWDTIETESSKIKQQSKPIDSKHSNDKISDFKIIQENERKLYVLQQPISEETTKTSTEFQENPQVPSKKPVEKDELPVRELEDLVRGPHRNEDQQNMSGRGRRSVAEKEEAALHAEECHAHNLRACGQPAMKKLLKGTDMKTKCRVREEFLNCMGEKRFLPCPSSSAGDPKGNKLHPFDDPMLRDLRKSLRKGLATTCIFGYSRAENTTLGI